MSKHIYTVFGLLAVLAAGWLLVSSISTTNQDAPEPDQATTISWQTYENERFKYSVEYPQEFVSQEGTQNNDGRVFASESGSTTLRVFGRHNIDNRSVDALVRDYTQRLDSLRDSQIASSSATLFGGSEGRRRTIKLLHNRNSVAVLELSNPLASLTESQQRRLLNSFRWQEDAAGDDGSQTTTSDQRPVSFVPDEAERLIRIEQPTQEATIDSPLEIAGEARGEWFFEADAPVVLTDWDGRIIAEGFIAAEGDWMTEEFVPFSGTLEFEAPEDSGPQSVRGSLIIQRANPSGRLENDMAVEIPVRFQR